MESSGCAEAKEHLRLDLLRLGTLKLKVPTTLHSDAGSRIYYVRCGRSVLIGVNSSEASTVQLLEEIRCFLLLSGIVGTFYIKDAGAKNGVCFLGRRFTLRDFREPQRVRTMSSAMRKISSVPLKKTGGGL